MIKSGTIKEVREIKSGVSGTGRTWTLYRVTFTDGFECTTFDNYYSEGQDVNLSVEKEIKQGRNGAKFENYRIVPSKPKRESVVAQNGKFEEIMGVLAGINEKLDQVLDDLNKRP